MVPEIGTAPIPPALQAGASTKLAFQAGTGGVELNPHRWFWRPIFYH